MQSRRLASNMRFPHRDPPTPEQMNAGAAVLRTLSLPRGTGKSLARCRGNLNHSESF